MLQNRHYTCSSLLRHVLFHALLIRHSITNTCPTRICRCVVCERVSYTGFDVCILNEEGRLTNVACKSFRQLENAANIYTCMCLYITCNVMFVNQHGCMDGTRLRCAGKQAGVQPASVRHL